jgi:hypothetical protein
VQGPPHALPEPFDALGVGAEGAARSMLDCVYWLEPQMAKRRWSSSGKNEGSLPRAAISCPSSLSIDC